MNTIFKNTIPFLLVFILIACGGEPATTVNSDVDINKELQELTQQMESEEHIEKVNKEEWRQYFDLMIPAPMQEMEGLNPDAELQYGYVEQIETPEGVKEVYENYLVVVRQLKSEIAGYPVDLELDVMTYRNDVVENFGADLQNFKVLEEAPQIEQINGLNAVKDELSAEIETVNGVIKLYYQLAVVEGENAFYQVLTWCVEEQKEIFRVDMKSILNSFSEK